METINTLYELISSVLTLIFIGMLLGVGFLLVVYRFIGKTKLIINYMPKNADIVFNCKEKEGE